MGRLLTEHVKDQCIYLVDMQGVVAGWNVGAQRLFGYAEEEILGRGSQCLSAEEETAAGAPEEDLRQALTNRRTESDRWLLRKDGSRFWSSVLTVGWLDRQGQSRGAARIVRDRTEARRQSDDHQERLRQALEEALDARRQAEEAHREDERRLRTLIDNLPNGAVYRVVQDSQTNDTRFTFVSAGVEKVFGVAAERALADPRLLYKAIHPDDLKRVLAEETEALGTLQPFDVEFRIINRSGELRWLHCRALPHRRTSFEVVWEGVMLDVTARKLAEQSLREAGRRKDEFLAMLGHELRNPLAPIRTGLEILALEQDSEIVRLMTGQVDHLVRLVDDLLDVSRIMRGKILLRREPVALARVIAQAIQIARPLIDGQHHQLTRSLPADDVWLDGDLVRLAQVFGNLLNNAAKYTPSGGHIWILAELEACEVVVRIRDNGMGIEPQLLPHVFELFTQGDRAIDRSQGGLGIGLTVVRSLVEMHGGTVTAHSDGAGLGCEFVVRLPYLDRHDRSQSAAAAERAERGYRILVVDDNVAATTVLRMLLNRLGPHTVSVAHDGPATLAAVDADHPDVILLDIGLPGMSGLEVARRLRDDTRNNDVLLVALTGYGTLEDRQAAETAGFDDFLIKPADMAALQRVFEHPKLEARPKL
jgi:PAS domain S-box-containing protein